LYWLGHGIHQPVVLAWRWGRVLPVPPVPPCPPRRSVVCAVVPAGRAGAGPLAPFPATAVHGLLLRPVRVGAVRPPGRPARPAVAPAALDGGVGQPPRRLPRGRRRRRPGRAAARRPGLPGGRPGPARPVAPDPAAGPRPCRG